MTIFNYQTLTFLLIIANILILQDNRSSLIFTPILMHKCLSFLLMAGLSVAREGRREKRGHRSRNQCSNNKRVGGVSYFFNDCKRRTYKTSLTFLTGKTGLMQRLRSAKTFLQASLEISRCGQGKQINRHTGSKFKIPLYLCPSVCIPFKLRSI